MYYRCFKHLLSVVSRLPASASLTARKREDPVITFLAIPPAFKNHKAFYHTRAETAYFNAQAVVQQGPTHPQYLEAVQLVDSWSEFKKTVVFGESELSTNVLPIKDECTTAAQQTAVSMKLNAFLNLVRKFE